jgi:hypothetical protein
MPGVSGDFGADHHQGPSAPPVLAIAAGVEARVIAEHHVVETGLVGGFGDLGYCPGAVAIGRVDVHRAGVIVIPGHPEAVLASGANGRVGFRRALSLRRVLKPLTQRRKQPLTCQDGQI